MQEEAMLAEQWRRPILVMHSIREALTTSCLAVRARHKLTGAQISHTFAQPAHNLTIPAQDATHTSHEPCPMAFNNVRNVCSKQQICTWHFPFPPTRLSLMAPSSMNCVQDKTAILVNTCMGLKSALAILVWRKALFPMQMATSGSTLYATSQTQTAGQGINTPFTEPQSEP